MLQSGVTHFPLADTDAEVWPCCDLLVSSSFRVHHDCRSQADSRQQKGRHAVNAEVIRLGDISASWLANQLDNDGVVQLRDVISKEWLEALRGWVTDHIADHGDGDFLIAQADEIGSPAHQLVSDPALQQLFSETAKLRLPKAVAGQHIQCGIPVRAGTSPKFRPRLFHYDTSVLTMLVPIFIPRAAIGSCGELAAFGNKRPFRRSVASHFVDMILTYNSVYRRRVAKAVLDSPEKHIVDFQPGDACVFWGYRTYHGNLPCARGLLRATLVLQYGQVHSDSWALRVAWTFSRSRRALRRFQYQPDTTVESVLAGTR